EVKLTYGIQKAATLRATEIELGHQSTRFAIASPSGELRCQVPLIGRHNIYNALAAVGAGIALNLPARSIESGLNALRPVPGRLEIISRGQPFGVFVDYAHTDDALRNVLLTLREIA